MNEMGFVVHWIPVLAVALVLTLVGFVLRARLRHGRPGQPASERRPIP